MNLVKRLFGKKEQSAAQKIEESAAERTHTFNRNGVCQACGCSRSGVQKFGWICKTAPAATSTNAHPTQQVASTENALAIKCEGCGAVYTLGVDAISMTSDELVKMMPGFIGKIPDGLMIGRTTTSDKEQLRHDLDTILRLVERGGFAKNVTRTTDGSMQ